MQAQTEGAPSGNGESELGMAGKDEQRNLKIDLIVEDDDRDCSDGQQETPSVSPSESRKSEKMEDFEANIRDGMLRSDLTARISNLKNIIIYEEVDMENDE